MNTDTRPWCSTMVDDNGVHVKGNWGYCDPECPCDGTECPFTENDEGKVFSKMLVNSTYK